MPTPTTPWGARALELLADGEWHARVELLEAIMPLIPPGIAFRHAEIHRNRGESRPNGPGPRVRGDDDTSVATGRRHIGTRQLHSLVRQNGTAAPRAERAVIDGVDCIRLTPPRTDT